MSRRKEYTLERLAQEASAFTRVRFGPAINVGYQSFQYGILLFPEPVGFPDESYPIIIIDDVNEQRLEILGLGHVDARIKGPRGRSRYQISLHLGVVEVSRISRVSISQPDAYGEPSTPMIINYWVEKAPFRYVERHKWIGLPRFKILALIDPSKRLL